MLFTFNFLIVISNNNNNYNNNYNNYNDYNNYNNHNNNKIIIIIIRAPYDQIYARYGKILEASSAQINVRDFCEAVLFAFDLNKDDYQLGLTKVFFKPNKQEFMEKILK